MMGADKTLKFLGFKVCGSGKQWNKQWDCGFVVTLEVW